ncbi:tetratricopeptide repeat protein [Desulfovibrio inopinatus]|uniref:tetratricopeptide repeat protein n=1 Tax=Desulfovibrio inopinatus TaxID=102109 RepID=UPI000400C43F|nr:tetratricopeptide repeat protein [Desulfovibrio inopinatus]
MSGEQDTPPLRKPLRGVFSTQASVYLGRGPSRQQAQDYLFFLIEEQDDGRLLAQRLNRNFIPTGRKREIARNTLLRDYIPEPSIYLNKVVPIMRTLERTVNKGDLHRQRGELFSAEFEYKNALRLDEEHVRATFGLGLTYLDRGENHNAEIIFKKIVRLNAPFEAEHKHLFNEFGIKLRKNRMYTEALHYYARAYKLCKSDENLLYNMARTFYELGKIRSAKHFLKKSLQINPAMKEARQFYNALENMKTNSPLDDVLMS